MQYSYALGPMVLLGGGQLLVSPVPLCEMSHLEGLRLNTVSRSQVVFYLTEHIHELV